MARVIVWRELFDRVDPDDWGPDWTAVGTFRVDGTNGVIEDPGDENPEASNETPSTTGLAVVNDGDFILHTILQTTGAAGYAYLQIQDEAAEHNVAIVLNWGHDGPAVGKSIWIKDYIGGDSDDFGTGLTLGSTYDVEFQIDRTNGKIRARCWLLGSQRPDWQVEADLDLPFVWTKIVVGSLGGNFAETGTPAIRQTADQTDSSLESFTFGSPVLAGSLILVRLVRGRSSVDPSMSAAGFTKLAGVHANSNGDEIDNGSAAFWGKIAAGGETTFNRDTSTGFQIMCAYEITDASLDGITVLSHSNAGSASTSDLGSFTAAVGLAFDVHIVSPQEAGVHDSYSAVAAGDFSQVHFGHVTESGGHQDETHYWMGNATGTGSNLHSAATFSGSPPIVNTAAIAVLVPGSEESGSSFLGKIDIIEIYTGQGDSDSRLTYREGYA